eukprot:1695327-Pyramimonas_sp.AAC.1
MASLADPAGQTKARREAVMEVHASPLALRGQLAGVEPRRSSPARPPPSRSGPWPCRPRVQS